MDHSVSWKEYFPNLLETVLCHQIFVFWVRGLKFWLLAYFFIFLNYAKFQLDWTSLILDIYKGPHFKFWLDWKKKTKILCPLFCLSVHKWWNLWVYQTVVHARRYFNCLLGSNIVCFDYGPSIILPTRSNNQFRNYIDIPNDNLQVREI